MKNKCINLITKLQDKNLYICFLVTMVFFGIFIFLILKNANLNSFIDSIENRTFDLRQSIIIKEGGKHANNDIVIVAVDDATYEYILGSYGEWPLPRDVYANIINSAIIIF